MKTVGAYEAKTHLAQLLDEVTAGASIMITRHGVPIAMLVPPRPSQQPDPASVVEAIRALRRSIAAGDGAGIRDLIEEGRRF